MTRDDIELLLEQVATWPEAAQDEFLTTFNQIEAKHVGAYQLSEDDRAALKRSWADVEAGRLVDDEEITALFNRHFG